jgi:hypothetical protein
MKLKNDNAFGIFEVIIILMFLGVFAIIAVPRLNIAAISKNKAQTTARKIVNDLRLTRRLAISNAATNTMGFELKMVGSVPYTSYEIENIDTHATVTSHTLDSDVSIDSPNGIRFMFGPLGNLKNGSGTELYVEVEGKSLFISIIPATGIVKCVEN